MNPEPQIPSTFQPLSPPQPAPEPATPPFKPSGRKPTGKIAQLPRTQRDIINKMLDDGDTYDAIQIEMAKHGLSLNGENISNWFQNGFQQYLQHQDYLAEMRLLRENASDLVQDYNVVQFHQAANQLAVGRIFKALNQQQLIDDPANYIRTLNALARLSRAALVLKQYEDENSRAAAQTTKSEPAHDPETQRRLMLAAFEGATGVKAAPGPIGPDLNEFFARSRRVDEADSLASSTVAHSASPSPIPDTQEATRSPSIEKQKPKIEYLEPCPECFAPLPPPQPSGDRLHPHCQKCGAPLRSPGALIEYCPHCRRLLPELNPAGHRPTPDCPHCNQPLPPPINLNAAPDQNPQLPHAA